MSKTSNKEKDIHQKRAKSLTNRRSDKETSTSSTVEVQEMNDTRTELEITVIGITDEGGKRNDIKIRTK